MTRSKTINYT